MDILIRPAIASDLPALVDIFNHYVINGHVTFDTELNTIGSRREWFESYGDGRYQLLVAIDDGTTVGCTYSSRYRPRPAFDTTVETSIYLAPHHRGRGMGSLLYAALFERLAAQPVHMALAAVALPNDASLALHRKHGFEEVGTFKEYAQKNGEWISSTWLHRRVSPFGLR
jgi:phosphinothricin acetyltransferase